MNENTVAFNAFLEDVKKTNPNFINGLNKATRDKLRLAFVQGRASMRPKCEHSYKRQPGLDAIYTCVHCGARDE